MTRADKLRTTCNKLKKIQEKFDKELTAMKVSQKQHRGRMSDLSKKFKLRVQKFETLNTKRVLSGYNLYMRYWSKKNHGQSNTEFVEWVANGWNNLSNARQERWRQQAANAEAS